MYETSQLQLNIGNQNIHIEKIKDIDALWDALIAKGDEHEDMMDERIPYWAELWPSALALSQYLCEMSFDWKGKKVLEIGAGLALPSILAAKLGASITVSDYLQEAILFAQKNLALNQIFDAKFLQLDWREPKIELAADVLIAADVAYETRMFEPLLLAFKQLCKPNGLILLAEPNRTLASEFLNDIENQGFIVSKKQVSQELYNIDYKINIFEIRRTI